MTRSKLGAVARVATVLLLASCGGKKTTPLSPTPILLAIFPSHATAGGPSFTLNVSGLQLTSTSVVNWNGQPRTTTLDQNTSELSSTIKASDIAKAGTAEVTIVNPSPGGGSSSALTFFIDPPPNPSPKITSLSPPEATAGGSAFSLTVNGTGFVPESLVNWNGQARSTTFENSSKLEAHIAMTDIANPGTAQVTVTTPAPGGGTSNSVSFPIKAAALGANFPLVVSVNTTGRAASGSSSSPRVDGSGRLVAFASEADDLVEAGNFGSIFVRDTCMNATPGCTARTVAVDLAPNGGAPDGKILGGLDISGNGRYVVFTSTARNLIPGGTHGSSGVFLRDTCMATAILLECSPSTMLVSLDLDGNEFEDAVGAPSISSDGRFVAFTGRAIGTGSNGSLGPLQVYVRVTCLNSVPGECSPRTFAISTDSSGLPGDSDSLSPSISKDGRFVVFASKASNLGGEGPRGPFQIFLHDTCMGEKIPAGCIPTTSMISISRDGEPGNDESMAPSMSSDGRFVAFCSSATNLDPNVGGNRSQILLRDNCIGASAPLGCRPSTTLISSSSGGDAGDGPSQNPQISASGRFVVFSSLAANLAPGATGLLAQTYVRDTCLGVNPRGRCKPQTVLVSVAPDGAPAIPPNPRDFPGVAINADGVFVTFDSAAINLTSPENVSGKGEVFLTLNPLR